MENWKYYICPICGDYHGTDDRFPVCDFCKYEDVIIFNEDEIEAIKNKIEAMPEDERKILEKGEPCDDPKYGLPINFAVGEYLRPKYVFNDPRFSKVKYNERVKAETEYIHKKRKEDEEFVAAYYGHPTITCPTCGSTNTKKISGLSKAASVGLFGIFSQKVKHQFKCNSCGYEW